MIYLDYSATTPVEKVVLNRFVDTNARFFANSNSKHALGHQTEKQIERAVQTIQTAFHCPHHRVIFTSGATEANNLAILGLAKKELQSRKHIITTAYEHSSVTAAIHQLATEGFEVELVSLLPNGTLDYEELKRLLRKDTLLVSIASVFSEMGHVQDLAKIAAIVHEVPGVYFHSDATQMIGKEEAAFQEVDILSYTAHKIYGLKGIGALLVKEGIELKKQIIGGHSFQKERSGTPAFPLIDSLAFSTKRAFANVLKRREYVQSLALYLQTRLLETSRFLLNNPENAIPHILNVSILGFSASTIQAKLSKNHIYVSTQSACQKGQSKSLAVERFTQDEERAKSAIRISISHLTTKSEIDHFIKVLNQL